MCSALKLLVPEIKRYFPLQLCAAVHEHALEMMEGQMMQQDALMAQLSQEMDNGRLLRLLSRLVMVSEGNQTSLEPNWSETGWPLLLCSA